MPDKKRIWRFIETPPADGAFNMALDEALMRLVELPVIRFYSWQPPAVSLGYFQSAKPSVLSRFEKAGYTVVRRPTGGGAICHIDELTFSVVTPPSHPLARSSAVAYEVLHSAIVDALASFDVHASIRGEVEERPPETFLCFERIISCDIVSDGLKLVGSAQRRTKDGFLQHGSIPINRNPFANCGYLNLFAKEKVSFDALRNALLESFARRLDVTFTESEPTDEERLLAERLVVEKYANPEWTFRR